MVLTRLLARLTNTLQATLFVYFYPWLWVDTDNAAGADQVRRHAMRQEGGVLHSSTPSWPGILGSPYSALDSSVFTLCRWTRHLSASLAREWPNLGPYLQHVHQDEGAEAPFV